MLSWKPKRNGNIYCSSACGRGCKYSEYLQAKKNAETLKNKMKTRGWTVRVWENLGWHYQIRKGYLYVFPVDKNRYMAGLATVKGASGTPSFWSDSKTYSNPNLAVEHQIEIAKSFTQNLNNIVSQAEKDFTPKILKKVA